MTAMSRIRWTAGLAVLLASCAAVPARADDCSSAQDCGNVVRGTGVLAIVLAIALGAAAVGNSLHRSSWVLQHLRLKAGQPGPPHVDLQDNRPRGEPPTHSVRLEPQPVCRVVVLDEAEP